MYCLTEISPRIELLVEVGRGEVLKIKIRGIFLTSAVTVRAARSRLSALKRDASNRTRISDANAETTPKSMIQFQTLYWSNELESMSV